MNQNRPFFSTNTNFFDESFRTSAPTNFNGHNVIVSQEQQRKVFDTLNTSVVGAHSGIHTLTPGNFSVLQSQKTFVPGGVTFTFPQQNVAQTTCFKCTPMPCDPNNVQAAVNNLYPAVNNTFPSSLEQQMAMSGLQQHGLESLNYHKQLNRNPFQLKFHFDSGTSCTDLLNHHSQIPASKAYPDFCNINGVIQQTQDHVNANTPKVLDRPPIMDASVFFPLPPIEFSSNAKKLILSKKIEPVSGYVVDVLQEDKKNSGDKKKVSFSDDKSDSPSKDDKSAQITSECICEAKKCRDKGAKKQSANSSIDDEETNSTKKKKDKKQKKNNHNSSESDSSKTQKNSEDSSEHEYNKEKSKNKKKKQNKKQRRNKSKNQPNDYSDSTDETISQYSSTSDLSDSNCN